jgi:transketolase
MIRLAISPSPRTIPLPHDYQFTFGRGTVVKEGKDAVLFAYGPVMVHEALVAAEMLQTHNVALKVINLPWLNRIDAHWLDSAIADYKTVFVLDNHSQYGGLGDSLLNALMASDQLRGKKLVKFGLDDFPVCGTPREVLAYHRLDGEHLAEKILASK